MLDNCRRMDVCVCVCVYNTWTTKKYGRSVFRNHIRLPVEDYQPCLQSFLAVAAANKGHLFGSLCDCGWRLQIQLLISQYRLKAYVVYSDTHTRSTKSGNQTFIHKHLGSGGTNTSVAIDGLYIISSISIKWYHPQVCVCVWSIRVDAFRPLSRICQVTIKWWPTFFSV